MSLASTTVGSPPPHGVFPRRHRFRIIVSTIVVMLCSSCSGGTTDPPEDTAEREAFIGAYLDLRATLLSGPSTDLDNEARDSILSAYGVTDQDLVDFIDMHGEDVEFMRDLWTEVETLQTERLEQNVQEEEDEATDGSDRTEDGDVGL